MKTMKTNLLKMLCLTAFVGMAFASCEKDDNNNPNEKYTVNVVSADQQKGKAYGSGEFNAGTVTRIWGTPEPGYQFDRWNDGNTENPRNITVNANVTYTAYFAEIGSDNDNTGGNPNVSDDFSCEFTFDGTHYDGGAYVSYGEEQGILCLAIYSGVEETDPIALINIEPHTGIQTAEGSTYVSCAVVFGYDDYLNDIIPHYGTAGGPATATINVTALDLTEGTATLTASGTLLDIIRYENTQHQETVLKSFTASAEGHWQIPSMQN